MPGDGSVLELKISSSSNRYSSAVKEVDWQILVKGSSQFCLLRLTILNMV
jgi:hypothetical protein